MFPDSVWIVGSTRSGKTTRLIEQFYRGASASPTPDAGSTALFFAAMGDNRLDLVDRIDTLTAGQCRYGSTTPLGFFHEEILLFFPLIAEQLDLKTQFPIRLRPETEQELATRLWQPDLQSGRLRLAGVRDYYMVRRTLDILQLAAFGGVPHEDITALLLAGIPPLEGPSSVWECMGEAIDRWWNWCLERGSLTYGIVTELYWRYLLPHPIYQHHLKERFHAIFADDVDEYPAVMRSLFECFLDQGIPIACTYNPDGAIRLGLGSDPKHLVGLADRCRVETLSPAVGSSLGSQWGSTILEWMRDPIFLPRLPASIQALQAVSRSQLLRQTAELIGSAVQAGQIQPQEIAIIAPGLDAIARYTLREILTSRGVPVICLNDQHPLTSSPMIRALLTLLALVYPNLGSLVDRESVAEMLVVLSQAPINPWVDEEMRPAWLETEGDDRENEQPSEAIYSPSQPIPVKPRIDPVRAGLLTDHCFLPDLEQPRLLPITVFPRWDRLGYQTSQAYGEIVHWIETQRQQQQQRLIPNPVVLLDRAIQRFLYGGSHLPYDQLSSLRELMETAQHYWEVQSRLNQIDRLEVPPSATVEQFIQLLRAGTITADPYPVRPVGKARQAVILSTIYQYRSDRRSHRWQFWLDAGSPYWLTGGSYLFGAGLMLQEWTLGQQWTAEKQLEANQQKLQRQVLDLLNRATERVYLCYSELGVNGQEQAGSLLSLVNAALPVDVQAGLELARF